VRGGWGRNKRGGCVGGGEGSGAGEGHEVGGGGGEVGGGREAGPATTVRGRRRGLVPRGPHGKAVQAACPGEAGNRARGQQALSIGPIDPAGVGAGSWDTRMDEAGGDRMD